MGIIPQKLKDSFCLDSVVDAGMNYKPPPPKLSEKRKKELMESTTLETPRSLFRSAFHILKPYWTKSGPKEIVTASALLATSLFMTWYAVQVTVDFGNWQSGMMNILGQIAQTVMADRPDLFIEAINQYGALKDILEQTPLLNDMLMQMPDTSSLLYDPELQDFLAQNPDLKTVLAENPTLSDIFVNFPGMEEKLAENPALFEQLSDFEKTLREKTSKMERVKAHLANMYAMTFGDFFTNWGTGLKMTFNSVAGAVQNGGELINEAAKNAVQTAWKSKDFVNIALKYTVMAITSYKASQYLALRWRAWSSGYYTSRFMDNKAYARLKSKFNNIDNPGQRIQEDPAKFTAGSISLLTGVMSAGMTIGSFSGMLWGMGSVMGVPHGIFYTALGYAGVLTAMTFGVGRKLPWIQRNQQWREADFRDSITAVHNTADQVAQNGNEAVEKELMAKRLKPVMKNSEREIGTQVKLILVDALPGNLSIPIPYIVGGLAMAEGALSLGGVQTLNYAFNRVTSSMSFVVNRFDQLAQMKAVADRIYLMDQTVEAARYLEEEKRQAIVTSGKEPALKR